MSAEATAPATGVAAREALMRAYLDAWNSHDPAAVAAFFAPGAVYEDTGAGETARGREAIRAHAASVMTAFPDLRFELVRAAHGDDFTAGEWRSEMTHTGAIAGLAPSGRWWRLSPCRDGFGGASGGGGSGEGETQEIGGRSAGQPRSASSCAASESRAASSFGRPTICTASGRPSAVKPIGTDIAGLPT